MMAKKDRFPSGYSASVAPHYESEGSGSSGRIDSIDGSKRKWVDLNSASRDGFTVPIQIIPLSRLSSFERKNLVLRLTSELEQIRLVQTKVETQKKKSVNNFLKSHSSDIISCTNGQQKGLQAGNFKKSAVGGNAPGNKNRGWNRGITGRFESSSNKPHVNFSAGTLKQCEVLLKKLMAQQFAWVFNTPVDVVKLNIPDYFDIIKTPMDLGTVKSKLSSGKYSSPSDFVADVRLTFTNAKTYNPPGTDVHVLAETFNQFFEMRWKAIEKKLVATSQSAPEKARGVAEAVVAKTLAPSKKRKLSPRQHEVIQEPTKRKMTDEEKHKLSRELEGFDGDLPDAVIDFLRAQTLNRGDGGEDEIEIDIDDLSDDTLFTLRKLLDEHLPNNQNNLARSEACEIELPNVSGLSNSSLQVDKGNDNDPIDEDVDIGGNEAPVTSYPPVLIEKDVVGRAEEYNEAGPDSDRGSECSKGSSAVKQEQDDLLCQTADSDKKDDTGDLVGEHPSASELDHLENGSAKPSSSNSDGQVDVEGVQDERPVSPDKMYRAAILKNRFLETILKAREKTLSQDEKMDPERLRREREELELHNKKEKARVQAEAKAAEDARKRAEEEAAAEEKRRRELEREAAREALLKMEKTVEINENSRFLEDLEMLRTAPPEQLLLPSSADETSPDVSQDGFGSFKFGSNNPLEQLGLYMKMDDEEEEAEPPNTAPEATGDVEEGEIDID